MRIFVLILVFVFSLLIAHTPVHADSQRAYQDYLFQFDVYRQKYNDFTIAKNEYEKFGSLTSQTDALEKTIAMLSQRDLLLRAYLLLLTEKLNENKGLTASEKSLYQRLISNEIGFLEKHSKLVEEIGSLRDAQTASLQLETHYNILQASMRQIITGISLGNLAVLSQAFDIAVADAKALTSTNRGLFIPTKQATIDRWLVQITNTQSLYEQKINTIITKNSQFTGKNIQSQEILFVDIQNSLAEAKQYLSEGTSFLGELSTALKYVE